MHQAGEAALGKFRAGIVDGGVDHFVIAAQHQHVGDRAAQGFAVGNREQMRLALAARGLDQGVVVEAVRLRQHGACDLDDVVEGERADRHRRRAVDRRQAIGKQRLGRGFDVMHQALEHVVEQTDLFVGITHRAVDEEVGHPAQGFDPARDGAVRERGLQFVKQTIGIGGNLRTHELCPGAFGQKQAGKGFFPAGSGNDVVRRWRCGCVPVPWLRRARGRRAREGCPGSRPA